MGSSVVERDQNGFIPGTPPPASLPGVCPAARTRHHPLPQHRAAVCLHPAAAEPSQHPGAVEWQKEEITSSPRNNRIGSRICRRGAVVSTTTCPDCPYSWKKEESSPSPRNHWTGSWICCRGSVVSTTARSNCPYCRKKEESSSSPRNNWTGSRICCRGPVVSTTTCPDCPYSRKKEESSPSPRNYPWTCSWICCRGPMVPSTTGTDCSSRINVVLCISCKIL